MKNNDKKEAPAVQVTEGTVTAQNTENTQGSTNMQRLKKPLVFALMGLVFAACLYLIFGRESAKETDAKINIGLNDVVPQVTGNGLPTDKGKAYEQEMLLEKDRKKREDVMALSDYWQADTVRDSKAGRTQALPETPDTPIKSNANPAVQSYQKMQHSLSSFYSKPPQDESLKEEVAALKEQLAQRENPQARTIESQIAIMEKSYQMAAKYFPGSAKAGDSLQSKPVKKEDTDHFMAVVPADKSVVSSLQRYETEPLYGQGIQSPQQHFSGTGSKEGQPEPANSIRACIHQTSKIIGEGPVQLRLLQEARIGNYTLKRGMLLTATAKFQANRLQLQVVSVEIDGSIVPVNLSVYDLDGQKGVNMPYSAENTAINGTLANMGNTSGSSFTLNRSAGQQITADMTKGLIQGVSGYFSKKVKTTKVTLVAGYQVLLVSKK